MIRSFKYRIINLFKCLEIIFLNEKTLNCHFQENGKIQMFINIEQEDSSKQETKHNTILKAKTSKLDFQKETSNESRKSHNQIKKKPQQKFIRKKSNLAFNSTFRFFLTNFKRLHEQNFDLKIVLRNMFFRKITCSDYEIFIHF